MAEINFNNLYNQLSPMDKMFYDQQFQNNYDPNKENLRLSGQENYDQMKAVYDAQQQVPETGIFDSIFGSASAAEMPQVPNLTYRNIDLPFDLRTGVTNTTAASPFLKSMADIDDSGDVNSDLVNQLIMENQMKTKNISFPNRSPFLFPEEKTGITSTDQAENFNFLNNTSPPFGTSVDNFQGFTDKEDFLGKTKQYETDKFGYRKEKNLLQKLAEFIPFAGEKSLGRAIINMLPKLSPEAQNIRNFYGSQFGLTPTGQVASGIMKGYNPVSGGFLNMITGGRFGQPTSYGLADAARKRIERIANRKIAQTDASRAKIAELQDIARADTISRARQQNPGVYEGRSGGFDTSAADRAGTSAGSGQGFSNKSGRGRTGY